MARVEVVLPKWGMTMQEATIETVKAVGDEVEEGDTVAEVSTEKVNGDVEAPVEGVVVEVLVAIGDVVQVGAPIAYIEDEG
jgi:pyruvate dehydrogenase E2 component (dihydrolipoamide acetyltransferase)